MESCKAEISESVRPGISGLSFGTMSGYLGNLQWVAADTETTGLNPWKRELIEIGAVLFDLEGIQDRFEVLIKPSKKHDPKARAIHNITDKELEEKGVDLKLAIESFLGFAGNHHLVFHNAPFDVTFLKLACESLKIPVPHNYYYDNLYLSRKLFPERQSHSLAYLREELNIDTGDAHRALADAEATALTFMETLRQKGRGITSKKTYNKFMRFHRRMNQFKIMLPKNLEEIEKYFERRIRGHEFIKVNYKDNTGEEYTQIVQPMDMMVFNQRLFIKAKVQMTAEEKLIPLQTATIFDSELGPIRF